MEPLEALATTDEILMEPDWMIAEVLSPEEEEAAPEFGLESEVEDGNI